MSTKQVNKELVEAWRRRNNRRLTENKEVKFIWPDRTQPTLIDEGASLRKQRLLGNCGRAANTSSRIVN